MLDKVTVAIDWSLLSQLLTSYGQTVGKLGDNETLRVSEVEYDGLDHVLEVQCDILMESIN